MYRMKHIPTGLYYCPSRELKHQYGKEPWEYTYVKSNLSTKGKIYPSRPTLKYIGGNFYVHFRNENEHTMKGKLADFVDSEWEIEEIGK